MAGTHEEPILRQGAQRGDEAWTWRGGLPAVVHLDLDGARHIFRLHGWNWSAGPDPVYATGVPRALDLFEELGIRATFFLIAEDLDDPEKEPLVREIVRRGHEIASHSMTHSPLEGLDAGQLRREVHGSRDRIHAGLGIAPRGFRAPFFSIDAPAVRSICDAGYAYDTSMMSGREVPGVRVPQRPDTLENGLLELPLPRHRPLPFPFHPSYSLVLGVRYFDWGLARHARAGAPLVLLFHLIDFAEPLPAGMLAGWKQRLFTLSHLGARTKLDACRRMLDRARRSFTFTDTTRLVDAVRGQRREGSS